MLSFNSSDLLKIGFEFAGDLALIWEPPYMVEGGGPWGVKELEGDGGSPFPNILRDFPGVAGPLLPPKLKVGKLILSCGNLVSVDGNEIVRWAPRMGLDAA